MSIRAYKIPLTNAPQYFNITLKLKEYRIACRWNASPDAGWFLDISDALTNEYILTDLPLTTGLDILEPFSYLGFGGSMVVFTDNNANAVPTYVDLGIQSNLYFVTEVAD